jgi:hypothetical protein
MYRNDYEQYIKWQATGKRAPQPLSEDKRYYFIKKPNLNKIFNKKYPVPSKPTKTKRCKSVGDYFFDHLLSIFFSIFEDILSAIGIFVILVFPILMIDFYVLNGFLSISALLSGYFFYSKRIDLENECIERGLELYTSEYKRYKNSINDTVERFKEDHFFNLESYLKNRVGKSVPNFLEKLKAAEILGIIEAIPKGNPYQFKNGVYSADIGYVDREKGVLLDIEIDENHHFANFKQWKRDKHRNNYFAENGWTVVRFTDYEIIENPERCVENIINIISEIENDFDLFLNKIKRL